MIFIPERGVLWKKQKKGVLHFESVLEFWRSGRDKVLKIGTVPPKSWRLVSLWIHYILSKFGPRSSVSFISWPFLKNVWRPLDLQLTFFLSSRRSGFDSLATESDTVLPTDFSRFDISFFIPIIIFLAYKKASEDDILYHLNGFVDQMQLFVDEHTSVMEVRLG